MNECIFSLFVFLLNAGLETWNQAPPLCRQSSEDGTLGEINGLWSLEDLARVM